MEHMKVDIMVAGGVAAGMSAASQAKRVNPQLHVVVFERGPYISYGACGMPYYLSGDIPDPMRLIALTPEEAHQKRGISVYTQHEVLDVDPDAHTALVRDLLSNREILVEWEKFILATGARAWTPPVKGMDLPGVFVLRTLSHALEFQQFLNSQRPRRAVILGGGPVGCEMAEALKKRGLDVVVVEFLEEIMNTIDADMGALVHEELRRNGVGVRTHRRVERVERTRDGLHVIIGEEVVNCDMILVATGVKPNTELLTKKGVAEGPAGSVDVDEYMCTSFEHVFACGDCADALDLVTGKKVYVPLGTTANKQGRVAGAVAAGVEVSFPGIVQTAAVKVFDLEVARTGLSERQAREAGFDVDTVQVRSRSRAGYYPGGTPVHVKLIYEKNTGKLLGGQVISREGAAKRVDVIAAVLYFGGTVKDLYNLDLSYAPPFAPVYDPLILAARRAYRWK